MEWPLPEGRTFDENIFSQDGKIEHPRADLTFFFKQMSSRFHDEWNMSSGKILLKLQVAQK